MFNYLLGALLPFTESEVVTTKVEWTWPCQTCRWRVLRVICLFSIFYSFQKTNIIFKQLLYALMAKKMWSQAEKGWEIQPYDRCLLCLCEPLFVVWLTTSSFSSCLSEASLYLLQSHTVLWSPVSAENECDRQLALRARQRFTERETKRELCQVSKAIGPFSDMIRTSGAKSEAGTA